jgi:hypothetical protein
MIENIFIVSTYLMDNDNKATDKDTHK